VLNTELQTDLYILFSNQRSLWLRRGSAPSWYLQTQPAVLHHSKYAEPKPSHLKGIGFLFEGRLGRWRLFQSAEGLWAVYLIWFLVFFCPLFHSSRNDPLEGVRYCSLSVESSDAHGYLLFFLLSFSHLSQSKQIYSGNNMVQSNLTCSACDNEVLPVVTPWGSRWRRRFPSRSWCTCESTRRHSPEEKHLNLQRPWEPLFSYTFWLCLLFYRLVTFLPRLRRWTKYTWSIYVLWYFLDSLYLTCKKI
jgi:hypothetical protein